MDELFIALFNAIAKSFLIGIGFIVFVLFIVFLFKRFIRRIKENKENNHLQK